MTSDSNSTTSLGERPLTVLQGLVRVGMVVSALVILKWTVDYLRDDSPNALGFDEQVTSRGTVEVTARLIKMPEKVSNDLPISCARLFQYQVLKIHRGNTEQRRIFVAHYNPGQPRAKAADSKVKNVGGKLKKFRAGARHRLALAVPLEQFYQGKIVDDFPKFKNKRILYWAVWTNPVN